MKFKQLLYLDPRCLAVVFTVLLMITLSWPFEFVAMNHVDWIKTSNGIEFVDEGQVVSPRPVNNLLKRLRDGEGLTIEVWAATKLAVQEGPARIVSLSSNHYFRNFTLGQEGADLDMRLRTEKTDRSGVYPHLAVSEVFNSTDTQHIVVTYDFVRQRVYVNGDRRADEKIPGGGFSNWSLNHQLVIGNEFNGERPWLGRIRLVAIYDRALTEDEVGRNYHAGWSVEDSASLDGRAQDGLAVLYLFDERSGDVVQVAAGAVSPLSLYFPRFVGANPYLSDRSSALDMTLNILLFMPFGAFLYMAFAGYRLLSKSDLLTIVAVITAGLLFSLGAEKLQCYIVGRHSSGADVFCNTLGTTIGILAVKYLAKWAPVLLEER